MRFWNNLHQVRAKPKYLKAKQFKKQKTKKNFH